MTKNNEKRLEKLNEMFNKLYSIREKEIQSMKSMFSTDEIYLMTFVPHLNDKNNIDGKIYINTYDGLEKRYKAEITLEISFKLADLIDRCLTKNVLPPPAIAIKGKQIGLIASDKRQREIMDEIFVQEGNCKWGYISTIC